MVLALVGDSTMTSDPFAAALSTGAAALARACGLALGVEGFFFRVTAFFLAATPQPFVNGARPHLYHPAPVCASLTTSSATCAAALRSVSTCAWAFSQNSARSLSRFRMRATASSP